MNNYFFTDIDQLFIQPTDGEFGKISVSGANSEKFQITSKHNCQVNSKAYAICESLVMIQPNDSSNDLVNIILKPLNQAVDTVTIDYFIYRGIKKSSIFNNSLIKSTGNDLCIQINKTILKLSQKFPLDTHMPEEYILGHGAIAENDFLAMIQPFNWLTGAITLNEILKTPNLKYNPFTVKGGAHIGDFNNEFGMEVVLEKAEATIAEARKADSFIISQKQNNLTGENLINNKVEKEKILHYFDIYHFYALNYEKAKIWIKNSNETAFKDISIKNDAQNEFINLKNHFTNKDWTFMDIRNHYNQSLNFDNILTSNLSIQLGNNASFTTDAFPKWPLIKYQTIGLDSITIRIPKSDFTLTRAYFRENNKDSNNFKAINFDTSNYSTPFKLQLPKTPNGTTIGTYFYFMFLKEFDGDAFPSEWVIKPQFFIDTVFDLEDLIENNFINNSNNFKMKGLQPFKKATKWKINDENTFVLKNNRSFIAKTGIAEDSENVYFFAFSNGESLSVSSVDLEIVTGESDKENFLNDILLPKIGEKDSLFSEQLTLNQSELYVLNDLLIYDNKITNRLRPDTDDFLLIGIDKANSLTQLMNAYLSFNNNLPKRMFLKYKRRIDQSISEKNYQAEVWIVGYGINENSEFTVKPVDTGIKVYFNDLSQKFFGTNKFNEKYYKRLLEVNKTLFGGVVFKGFNFAMRSTPVINDNNILMKTGLENIHFRLLGKYNSPTATDERAKNWYYIELVNDTRSGEITNLDSNDDVISTSELNDILVQKGTRGFISKSSSPYIYAKFGQFIEDLSLLNSQLDVLPASLNDNINARITRIRQRTHDGGKLDLIFNKVIKDSFFNSDFNIEDIPYEAGQVFVDSFNGPSYAIDTKIQLLKNYDGVEFYNGEIADIQHLFVGLDVLNTKNENLSLLRNFKNYHIALYAGDAGTVPANMLDIINEEFVENKDAPKFIKNLDILLRRKLANQTSFFTPLERQYYEFLQNKQFSRYDMLGDLYGFGLHKIKSRLTFNDINSNSVNPSTSKKIEEIFKVFNSNISVYEKEAVNSFYEELGLQQSSTINNPNNSVVYNKIIEDTIHFSMIWYKFKINPIETVFTEFMDLVIAPLGGVDLLDGFSSSEIEILEKYSKISIQEFIDLVNNIENK